MVVGVLVSGYWLVIRFSWLNLNQMST